jgi:stage V sporulation protein SpoVS
MTAQPSATLPVFEARVSAVTNVKDLSMAIAARIEKGHRVRLICAGMSAVNQGAKAAGRSRMFLAQKNIAVLWSIYFKTVNSSSRGEDISAVIFESEVRPDPV